MSFSELPSSITLKIFDYLDNDLQTVSALSQTSKKINRYIKNEPTVLIRILTQTVNELNAYKYIVKLTTSV